MGEGGREWGRDEVFIVYSPPPFTVAVGESTASDQVRWRFLKV